LPSITLKRAINQEQNYDFKNCTAAGKKYKLEPHFEYRRKHNRIAIVEGHALINDDLSGATDNNNKGKSIGD
jgi:hypothetical protein